MANPENNFTAEFCPAGKGADRTEGVNCETRDTETITVKILGPKDANGEVRPFAQSFHGQTRTIPLERDEDITLK